MTLGSGSLGGASLGGIQSFGSKDPPVSVLIGTDDLGPLYEPGSLSVSDQLNGRNTLNLRLKDVTRAVKVAAGKPITVWFDGVRVFAGTVERAREIVDISQALKVLDVSAVDFNQLADRYRLFGSFESVVMELNPPAELEAVSDSIDDTTQTVTVDGLDPDGAVISSAKTLSGTTPVKLDGEFAEVTRILKSANTKGTINVRVAGAGATVRNLGPELNDVQKQIVLLADAVEDIVTLLTPLSTDEGVTTGGVQIDAATIVTKLRMSGQKASEIFDDLAEHFGWAWYIDYDKALHFFDRSLHRAPLGFGDGAGQEGRYRSATYETDRGEYRNRQYLRAGKDRVGTAIPGGLAETFKGDAERRTWDLQMEVAGGPDSNDKPRIQVISGSTTTTVPAGKIGLQGRDDQDATVSGSSEPIFHWFFKPGATTIAMNPNLKSSHVAYPVPLGTADTLRVQYYGQVLLLVQADNLGEQAARKAVEGGGGLYEDLEQDESVDGLEAAVERAQGVLARRDQIFDTVTIETFLGGFAAGQLIPLSFADYGISGDLLIDRVQVSDLDGLLLVSQIEAINHDLAASDFQLWKKLAKIGQRPFIVRENERLHLLRRFTEQISFSEVSAIQSGDFLDPEIDDDSGLQDGMLQHGGIMNGGEVF